MRRGWFGWLLTTCLAFTASVRADEISVAVAADFAATLAKLAASFEKIVLGMSVAHAFQFADSGTADCAFVAYSQALAAPPGGSFWLVPDSLYPPLNQEAVLLKAGDEKPAAQAFLKWLKSDRKALGTVRAAGYAVLER